MAKAKAKKSFRKRNSGRRLLLTSPPEYCRVHGVPVPTQRQSVYFTDIGTEKGFNIQIEFETAKLVRERLGTLYDFISGKIEQFGFSDESVGQIIAASEVYLYHVRQMKDLGHISNKGQLADVLDTRNVSLLYMEHPDNFGLVAQLGSRSKSEVELRNLRADRIESINETVTDKDRKSWACSSHKAFLALNKRDFSYPAGYRPIK